MYCHLSSKTKRILSVKWYIQTFSNFHDRFFEDTLLFWNTSKTQLLDLIARLNCENPTIKFYGTYSKSRVFKHKNLQMQPEKHVSDNSMWESNT